MKYIVLIVSLLSLSCNACDQTYELVDTIDGVDFYQKDGGLYYGSECEFYTQWFDPNYVNNTYSVINGHVYYAGQYQVNRFYNDGFEYYSAVTDLIDISRWHSFTLHGQASPTTVEYLQLRDDILSGQSDFIDNRFDPDYSMGPHAIKFVAETANNLLITKTSIENQLIFFQRGDEVWIKALFYIEEGLPTSLVDIESSYVVGSPGMRLLLTPSLSPYIELKFGSKPKWNSSVQMPINQWVEFVIAFKLDSISAPVVAWMDGQKIINGTGKTSPYHDAIYTNMEIGITANDSSIKTVIYADDIAIQSTPFAGYE